MPATWICPFCHQIATITDSNYSIDKHKFTKNNLEDAELWLETIATICPNQSCREYSLKAALYKTKDAVTYPASVKATLPALLEWQLRPRSKAKPMPSFIPQSIAEDYTEACLIVNDSPKASATLSRRCLQGVIRDFWGISKPRLIDEINELKGKIDKVTWDAIDAVRSIGNIGAHMEKDINQIVAVESGEAEVLIQLLETLFKEWYVNRNDRDEHMKQIVAIAQAKNAAKSVLKGSALAS